MLEISYGRQEISFSGTTRVRSNDERQRTVPRRSDDVTLANNAVDLAQSRPLLTSYTVLRWEIPLRASTILGLAGGGGLGQAIYSNVQRGFYSRLSTLILPVYALVPTSDRMGERLRSRIA